MLVQFGNNWIQKIPLTAQLDSACGLVQFWLSSEFFSSNYFQIGQHVVLLHIQMCRLERLHCQQPPPFYLLTWKNADVDWSRDLFRLSRGAFWCNVALKVDGEGVTRTNSDHVRATMLQQFESTSNCCNMLPQQNVALKIVRRAMLHDVDF